MCPRRKVRYMGKNMTEQEKRAAIVNEARSWLGTPYHVRACVKGVGCDCSSFLMGVGIGCGMILNDEIEELVYSGDCWAHWSDEKYRRIVMKHTSKLLESTVYRCGPGLPFAPGTLILVRVGGSRFLNHGAIVTDWPKIIHSVQPCVEEVDASMNAMWANNTAEAFDFKRLKGIE